MEAATPEPAREQQSDVTIKPYIFSQNRQGDLHIADGRVVEPLTKVKTTNEQRLGASAANAIE